MTRSPTQRHRGRLAAVFAISLVVLAVEIVGGLISGSLALLADAAHVLTDVVGVGLALVAVWLGARPPTARRTFGLYRLEILAAAANAVILLGLAALIVVEAVRRLADPPEIAGGVMLLVAVLGMGANAVALRILHRVQGESLNVRGAYLEVLGDLLASVAVIGAALVVALTGFRAADPIASILVAAMILPRTWGLLGQAVDVLLQATPRDVNLDQVRGHICGTPGVAGCHDLHVWTLTSGMNVVSAHVVLEEDADPAAVLDRLCGCLAEDFDIEHSTFQLETRDRRRLEQASHD